MTRLLLTAAALCLALGPVAQTTAWINEIHYANVGADTAEFVEVVLPAGAAPASYTISLYRSSGTRYEVEPVSSCTVGSSYDVDSDGDEDYTFYSCSAEEIGGSGGAIQNGPSNGIALTGADPLNPAYPLIHFLSYEGTVAATENSAAGQASLDIGVEESDATTLYTQSVRLVGTGLEYESFAWQGPGLPTDLSTPGAINPGQTLATPSGTSTAYLFGSGDDDVAGFRQLGAALAGIRVDDLAGRNLVQGIPGADGYPAQYPDADGTTEGSQGPNLYTAYDGAGYTVAPSTADVLQLGRGFLWYLFDQRIDPDDTLFGGGTSESFPLPQSQTYAGYGLTSGTYVLAFDRVGGQTFYLLANPRASDYDLSGIGVRTTGATLSTTFQVYDPGTNGYAALTEGTDALAKGQGVWAEVTGVTADAVTFGFDLGATTTGGVFHGRRAAAPTIDLRLDGVTSGGLVTADGAARISLRDDATDGWDRHDASKLTPLSAPYALIAPVGTRDGEPRHQAVRSAPIGPLATRLAFTATEAGTYTLSADVPSGWAAHLTDRATGATTDLALAGYAFEADATGWADRFELAVSPATAQEETASALAEVGRPFPNPAAAGARLRVRVGATERVRVAVYDALGREAALAFDGPLAGGADAVVDLPGGLPAGVYVVRVTGETVAQSRRWVVVR